MLTLEVWRRAVPAVGRLWRAVRLVWASSRGWTAASVLLVVVQSALPLAQLYLLKLIVDAVAGAVTASTSVAFERITGLIVMAAAAALLGAVCRSLGSLVAEGQARAVSDHLHEIVHDDSLTTSY